MLKKRFFALTVALGGLLAISSCSNEKPGWEYMPDMYRGPALEAYQPNGFFADSLSARKPVEGTIARGFMAYDLYTNDNAGYDSAKVNMMPPADMKMDSLAMVDAAKLYGIYCGHCHGEKGDGQGILMKREKFLGIPSYADREITMGSIFHVVTYGKGVMGSHAAQVNPEERWEIAAHVMKLRAALTGEGETKEEAKEESAEATTAEANEEQTEETNKG